jgi:hypothetical protein
MKIGDLGRHVVLDGESILCELVRLADLMAMILRFFSFDVLGQT